MQTTTLKQTSASAKEQYINSAKTYDGKGCKEFNNWLESVYRLSRISAKDLIEVALATSTGSLHKHISALMALGNNWDVIKNKVQERFSEFGSPIVAQSKLSSFTQGTMAMHEYISEFTDLVEHAHQIKPIDTGSHLLARQFIQGISNLYVKSRLRFLISMTQLHNLSELFGFALQEDQKQKKGNLILAKITHTLISMPSKAKVVLNVVVKTIILKTALTIRTMATMTMVTVTLTILNSKAKDFIEPREMKAPLKKHFKR